MAIIIIYNEQYTLKKHTQSCIRYGN